MEIQTLRLYIRPPKPEDFDRFWSMMTDPVAKQYTGGITCMTYQDRRELFLADAEASVGEAGAEFTVLHRETGQYLGYCGIRPSDTLPENEFFYGYCQDSWGKGYGTEAAYGVLRWCFQTLPHEAYVATAPVENAASIRILEKLGFVLVGDWQDGDEGLYLYRLERRAFAAVQQP